MSESPMAEWKHLTQSVPKSSQGIKRVGNFVALRFLQLQKNHSVER